MLCFRPAPTPSPCSLSNISRANVSTYAERKLHKDPYVLAQSRRRKESNLRRRAELEKERESMLGDPVRGVTTPFVESFDTAGASTVNFDATTTQAPGEAVQIKGADDVLLNHFLTPSELQSAIEHSRSLTEPVEAVNEEGIVDPVRKEHEKKRFEDHHARASAALARIVSLANGNSKDKTRANVRRCIETFGRHKTDGVLRPRPPPNPEILGEGQDIPEKTPRAGPDTGSSEVQIAILTAKIRVLANQLEMKRGQKDKVNKRNLRLLVHRRQKLLKYLRKKERGGERWQNLIATLGLTEGTWQGEISL
ncbi:ribosomal S15 precursor protein [Rutstroemia sp. NJR-2017a BVV2]|nr:ribosomal S15 precursor protein [Rutstroemia sp. NJR-2017a BVV2]